MKLNVAVVVAKGKKNETGVGSLEGVERTEPKNAKTILVGMAALGATLSLLTSGAAFALDGIDLSEPAEAAAGECPQLIKIKYPFLDCEDGHLKTSDANDTWENSRRMPRQSDFMEGDGAWGPALNRN